jgi:hypothetical protein
VEADRDVETLVAEVRRLQAQRDALLAAGRELMVQIDTVAWSDVTAITRAESSTSSRPSPSRPLPIN